MLQSCIEGTILGGCAGIEQWLHIKPFHLISAKAHPLRVVSWALYFRRDIQANRVCPGASGVWEG